MKVIRYSSEDLKDRAGILRNLVGRYDHIQSELNHVMNDLKEVYLIDNKSVVIDELNLSSSIEDISLKLRKLAYLLEERANQIENESYNSD